MLGSPSAAGAGFPAVSLPSGETSPALSAGTPGVTGGSPGVRGVAAPSVLPSAAVSTSSAPGAPAVLGQTTARPSGGTLARTGASAGIARLGVSALAAGAGAGAVRRRATATREEAHRPGADGQH
jgi:hypothetical protein